MKKSILVLCVLFLLGACSTEPNSNTGNNDTEENITITEEILHLKKWKYIVRKVYTNINNIGTQTNFYYRTNGVYIYSERTVTNEKVVFSGKMPKNIQVTSINNPSFKALITRYTNIITTNKEILYNSDYKYYYCEYNIFIKNTFKIDATSTVKKNYCSGPVIGQYTTNVSSFLLDIPNNLGDRPSVKLKFPHLFLPTHPNYGGSHEDYETATVTVRYGKNLNISNYIKGATDSVINPIRETNYRLFGDSQIEEIVPYKTNFITNNSRPVEHITNKNITNYYKDNEFLGTNFIDGEFIN